MFSSKEKINTLFIKKQKFTAPKKFYFFDFRILARKTVSKLCDAQRIELRNFQAIDD